ncbi:hypothetical protein J2X32_003727 [Rheinheimera pacifica]|uniref:YIP1 family protein n=1 Tax=Rheinheimera pacifica TaxID=173990 RepID=UPI0028670F16|nr:YIP1 family protein [Rheinheimera pacifica]MDR6985071.1 hypothetical protein [Rheinheimera pacifica]
MGLLNSLFDVFVSPASLFGRIKYGERWGGWVFAILTLAIFTLYFSFYSVIDSEWLVQRQLAEIQDLPTSQREEIARIFRNLAGYAGWIATLFSVMLMLLAVAVLSFYYMYMDQSTEKKSYEQWFTFTLWTQTPVLVSTLIFVVMLFTVPEQDFRPDLINYSSLSHILNISNENEVLYSLGSSLNLFYVWNIFLATVGIKIWTDTSFTKAAFIALTPYVVYVVAQILMA